MNYLAHAYLSFRDPEILLGNLISDFVKGKRKFGYPIPVQQGIQLHRSIDDFTDSHPSTYEAKQFFRPAYRLYSGAFIDIVYDHFLATDKSIFHGDEELMQFSQESYLELESMHTFFPVRFQQFFHYMQTQNWLYHYQFKEGIYNSFAGLVRRAKYMKDYKKACQIFDANYESLRNCYQSFFPEVHAFALEHYVSLQRDDYDD